MILDCYEDMVRPVEDLGVVEAQDSEAMTLHEGVSSGIVETAVVRFVRVSIDFNHDSRRKPGKVGDVWADRGFSAEASAIGAQIAEHVPHRGFRLGHFAAQSSRPLSRFWGDV
jgi:hypothetical protein